MALADWAEGREWAVGTFALLSIAALLCGIVRGATEARAAGTTKKAAATTAVQGEFVRFQRSYLLVYVLVMLADWLQGTHMYTLYSKYAETNAAVSVGALFFFGFLSAGVLGTFTGPLVDRYGRKRACLVYVALEVVINLLEHINGVYWLLLGRALGGISTSLLFSAFEAWMVTEHRRRGFAEEWLTRTFGLCAVWNGATAIVAGFLAQLAADKLGDIGPFQLAIALTIAAGVCILPWRENYGGGSGEAAEPPRAASPKRKPKSPAAASPARGRSPGRSSSPRATRSGSAGKRRAASPARSATKAKAAKAEAPQDAGLLAAWRAVRAAPALLVLGGVYALFEGAMYTFVFNWVPTLARALGGFGAFAPVQGLLFSCLMAAISIGGELYNFAARVLPVETIGVAIFATATGCMLVPVWCELAGCGPYPFGMQFGCFLAFEVCVGAFQPCVATHRSKYVPDAMQSTVNNLFRLPLNMLVAAGTVLSDYFSPAVIFSICAAAHGVAALSQAWLALRTAREAKRR